MELGGRGGEEDGAKGDGVDRGKEITGSDNSCYSSILSVITNIYYYTNTQIQN